MKQVLMALRNLNRQKKRTFLLGGAIAFGIAIVSLINAFAGSFVENVSENFSHFLAGHIFVEGVERSASGNEVQVIRDDQVITQALATTDVPVRFVTRRSEFQGELIFQGNVIRQAIAGADWSREDYLLERLVLVSGNFDNMSLTTDAGFRNGLILSKDVVDRLRAEVGDVITVRMRTVTGQRNIGDFRLAAVSYDPGLFGSISGFADLQYVNSLIGLEPDEYQRLGVFVDSIPNIDGHVDRFYPHLSGLVNVFERQQADSGERNPVRALFETPEEEQWEGVRYRVFTLNDLLSQVKQIVDILNSAALVILLVLFFIIMVGITNTFRMIMYERVKEIGTMRALGMPRGSVLRLFLLEAVLLALAGSVGGLLIAGIAMVILGSINLGVDSPVFILLRNGYLTFSVQPLQVLFNFAVVTLLTTIAALFPSRKAAWMRPVDALRA